LLRGWCGTFARCPRGHEIAAFTGNGDYVAAVAFAPDGNLLATGSYDQSARLWDITSKQLRYTLRGHRGVVMSVAFSPDGRTLGTASIDQTIKLWNVATGQVKATLKGHKSWVNSPHVHPDGDALISEAPTGR
jgi:WD40 repeat protein